MKPKFMFLFIIIHSPNSPSRNIDVNLSSIVNWWVESVVVLYQFEAWCLEEIEFLDEDNFDVDYQWFSYVWDGF
jgi:hypothetical protein